MIKDNLGILHPGEMGITVALAAQNSGFQVHWASAGHNPPVPVGRTGRTDSFIFFCGATGGKCDW